MIHRLLPTMLVGLIVLAALGGCTGKPKKDAAAAPSPPRELTVITEANFREKVTSAPVTLVDFGGKFCRPCKEMKKILGQFMQRHPDIPVYLVYSEDSPELLERWGVQMIPTQVVFDARGKELTRHVGVWTLAQMTEALRKLNLLS